MSVVDSGIGIRAAHLGHVFEMFGQGHRAHDPVYGGLGIGLTLAKSIAELHGGSLTAASEGEGKGSAFTLRIACAAADAVAPREADAPEGVPPPPRRILVVDDNVDAALTLAELLDARGPRDARRPRRPVRRGRGAPAEPGRRDPRHRPARIRRVRGRRAASAPSRRSRQLLLVALSGWVQPGDLARSREAGFDHHFAKPVPLTSLELVLREASGDRGRTP